MKITLCILIFGQHTPPDNTPHCFNDRRACVANLPRAAATLETPVLATRDPFAPRMPDRPTIAISPRGTLLISFRRDRQ